MRATLLKFLLPLLLLLAQQGVLAHEISHLGEALGQPRQHESHKQLPGNLSCEKCLAFAHLSGAPTSEAPPPLVDFLAYDHATARPAAELAAETLSPRSRGPPVFL
jgi:hypothetical protein